MRIRSRCPAQIEAVIIHLYADGNEDEENYYLEEDDAIDAAERLIKIFSL